MNPLNYISDEEFLPFLQSLEVESDRKSFEWMFNDPELSGILRWLHNSLDHSNALTTREKYRYAEIENQLLPLEDLDTYIESLQEEFEGLCLPGDQECIHDVKMDIQMQNERLKHLVKQEAVVKDLIKQNDLTKDELSREITKLHSAQHQLSQDEANAGEECLALAAEVETLTEGVVDVIADTLSLYSRAQGDKEIAKKFVAFGPYESYRQAQALFRSHFDMFVSRRLSGRREDVTDEGLRSAMAEANVMGQRLSDAALAYADAKTELAGEQAKLNLVLNYQDVHPSRVAQLSMEEQAALDMEQEEPYLEQQVQAAVRELAEARTRLAAETTALAALAVRQRVHTDLSQLAAAAGRALRLDAALLGGLRAAGRGAAAAARLAAQLQAYLQEEDAAAADRIKSMHEICAEQETCERRLTSSNYLLDALCSILGVKSDDGLLVKGYHDLQAEVVELREDLYESYARRERDVDDFRKSAAAVYRVVYDGSTKRPNCWQPGAAAALGAARGRLAGVEAAVADAGGRFSAVKNGDKQGLRKLWQWFLTDQNRLAAAMRAAQNRGFN